MDKVELLAQMLALAVTAPTEHHCEMAKQASYSIADGMLAKDIIKAKKIAEEIIDGVLNANCA